MRPTGSSSPRTTSRVLQAQGRRNRRLSTSLSNQGEQLREGADIKTSRRRRLPRRHGPTEHDQEAVRRRARPPGAELCGRKEPSSRGCCAATPSRPPPIPMMRYHDDEFKPYAYDIAKAKALLAEAGQAGGFSATLLLPSGDVTTAGCDRHPGRSERVGVALPLQNIEAAPSIARRKPATMRCRSAMPPVTPSIPTKWSVSPRSIRSAPTPSIRSGRRPCKRPLRFRTPYARWT